MRLFTLKLLFVSAVASALMLAGAVGVSANVANQNPDFIVLADLSPDAAAVGDELTVSASVANTTGRWQYVRVCWFRRVNDNDGVRRCDLKLIGPYRVRSYTRTFTMPNAVPGTTLQIGVSATNANGTSFASDSLTLS
jgi:hypothetical protein